MNKEDWAEYDRLHKKYEEAQQAYVDAQTKLRGAFSELSRSYEEGTLDQNRLYEEEKAHERFVAARQKLHEFLQEKLKKD